jgi:transcriptional regulator with PAS, ATPase and Fis domain
MEWTRMIHSSQALSFLGMPAVYSSEPMRQLLLMVERVALSNASVLVCGESGSGKELIARAIHHYSLRSSKPWVDVSCAALPEHLIESELFGYDKGAFSGADSNKQGLFELAHGGTLFLDEVGELEPKMQVKLLRVLDGTPYYRLGGVRKIAVDVRVIAATNRNLEEAIAEGRFRRDLFHRLSQIDLKVPPLRDRVDDILPLAQFFLEQQNARLRFAPDAIAKLERYAWPGNIRELRNVVIRAAVLTRDAEIRAHQLPVELVAAAAQTKTSVSDLGGMERQMIFEVLEKTGGHHQRAAELLGISRRTLSRKLKLYSEGEGVNCVS